VAGLGDAGVGRAGWQLVGAGSFSQVASTAVGTTSFSDTNLEAGSSYTYRVRAYNQYGDSAYSAEASGSTTRSETTAYTYDH
jgi:hypothetical protein